MYRLEKEKPTIEDEEELNVFLGVSKKQLIKRTNSQTEPVHTPPLKNHIRSTSYKELRGNSPKVDTSIFKQSPPAQPFKNRPSSIPFEKQEKKKREISVSAPKTVSIVENTEIYKIPKEKVTEKEPEKEEKNVKKQPEVNPSIEALKVYYGLQVPKKGQSVKLSASQYLNPITFRRPFFDEQEELFAEWGLPLTFHLLSFKSIIVMLSAVLLERKVIVCCKSLRFLSALVLALPPLLRPFLYQSVIIPMLPQSLPHLLDAPVPYVIGVTQIPEESIIPEDVVIIDVAKNTFKSSLPIPLLPNSRQLYPLHFFFFTFLHFTFSNLIP